MNNPLARFAVRWLICALGLWIAAGVLTGGITYGDSAVTIIASGLVLAIINTFIRPVVVIFSLPFLLVTLGFFMIVINALMILLASWLFSPLHVAGFWAAIVAGIIVGLVNYLVTTILTSKEAKE